MGNEQGVASMQPRGLRKRNEKAAPETVKLLQYHKKIKIKLGGSKNEVASVAEEQHLALRFIFLTRQVLQSP